MSRDDTDLLVLRVDADAVGTDSFRAGGLTYNITYTDPGPQTRPDVFAYDGVGGEVTFNPLLNDEGAGERWIYPINPTIGVGTLGHDPDGLVLYPTSFRLVSVENLSPDKGEIETSTRPVTIGGRRTDILNERLTFVPSPEANGVAQLEYVVEDATGARATETIEILLLVSTDQLVAEGSSARIHVPTGPEDSDSWMTQDFNDNAWTQGPNTVGYENNNGYQSLIGTDVDKMSGETASCYLRIPFQVEDAAQYSRLVMNMRYDDGFVAYLNGSEVARANAQGTAPLPWDSEATSSHSDAQAEQFIAFDLSQHTSTLHDGENLLAIHGLNVAADSSDFLMIPTLDAVAVSEYKPGTEPEPILPELTILTEPSLGGNATGEGAFESGTEAIILAVPNEGYRFGGWIGAGVGDPSAASTTTTLTADNEITATFIKIWNLDLQVHSQTGGSVIGSGAYDDQSSITISAVPEPGYRFASWQGESLAFPDRPTTTIKVEADTTISATFIKVWSLRIDSSTGGTVSSGGSFDDLSEAIITATPNEDYEFLRWEGGEFNDPNSATTEISMTMNRLVTARFQPISPDQDKDGMLDSWEAYHGITDPHQDDDHDGATNLQEFLAQTDPTNSGSLLRIHTVKLTADGNLKLSWQSVPGITYQVETTKDLTSDSWTALTPIIASESSTTLSLANPKRDQWYLRVIVALTLHTKP